MMHDVAEFFQQSGFAAFCPSYRLAPLHPCPSAMNDIQAFIRFLRANTNQFQIDADAIAAFGNSAGGHLAAIAGVCDSQSDGVSSKANAVVALCPITDFEDPRGELLPISLSFIEQFMGCGFEGNEEFWAQAGPMRHACESASPFFLAHGDADDIVPIGQSEALASKLFTLGVPVEFHRLPGEGHSLSYQAWTRLEPMMLSFLRKSLCSEVVA